MPTRTLVVLAGLGALIVCYYVAAQVLMSKPPALRARATPQGTMILSPLKRWTFVTALALCVATGVLVFGFGKIRSQLVLFVFFPICVAAGFIGPLYMFLNHLLVRVEIAGSVLRVRSWMGKITELDLHSVTQIRFSAANRALIFEGRGVEVSFPFRMNGVGSLVEEVERAGLAETVVSPDVRRLFDSVVQLGKAQGDLKR